MGNLEVDETMLEVKKSNIKNAGMGLFARVDIPPKVKLGYFGGYYRVFYVQRHYQ